MKASRFDKGQGLIEFGIVMVFLILIVFGVLDLGRVFFSIITISNAAREGARYLTLHPDDKASAYAGTKAAGVQEAQGSIIHIQPSDVTVTYCVDLDAFDSCDSGYPVRVKVQYQFTPIMSWIMRGPYLLQRSVEMMVP
jgi:Flp pilus assembly protein TadG